MIDLCTLGTCPDTLKPMRRLRLALLTSCTLLVSVSGQAQTFESMGNRALGMGGAFVGVSSDTTATFWNPAGMAVGGPSPGGTFGWVRFQSRDRDKLATPGSELQQSAFTSFGGGPIGFSWGKFQTTSLFNSPDGTLSAETLHVSQFGVTVLQSLTKGLVLGSTLKWMWGYSAVAPVTNLNVDEALKAGEALGGNNVDKFDYDVGIMMDTPHLRLGVTIKNMQQPSFPSSAGTAITLKRHARFGLAVLPTTGLTLAMDIDLDTVDLMGGLRRMIAFGGEDLIGHHVAVRGGIRWSLEGDRRRVGSAGVSYQLKKGFWLDSQYTQGDYGADRGYGVTLRAGF
jgi:F plasmid transfer operon, TraF, protein